MSSASTREPVRIDGHVHVFQTKVLDSERTVDALVPPDRDAPVELLCEVMDGHDVDGAVLVPLGPERGYVANCLARHPERFVGICVADARLHADPVHELVALTASGFRGVRMAWLGEPGKPIRESPTYATLKAMAAQNVVLWFYAPPAQLPLLTEAVRLLPDLIVCLNHLGFCPDGMAVDQYRRPRMRTSQPLATSTSVLQLASAPNVYVMLSGLYGWSRGNYPYLDLCDSVRALYDAFGADRLFWASDFPWILEQPGYAALLALPALHLPDLSDSECADIMAGTVARIFPGGWAADAA